MTIDLSGTRVYYNENGGNGNNGGKTKTNNTNSILIIVIIALRVLRIRTKLQALGFLINALLNVSSSRL